MKLKNIIAIAVLTLTCSLASEAQQTNGFVVQGTNVIPIVAPVVDASVTNETFIQSLMAYFTSFDTNSTTFGTNAPFEIFTGVKFQSGIQLGALLGVEWAPSSKVSWLTLRDVATFADTVGTVSENEFDVGAFMVHYDLKFGAFVGVDTQIAINRWEAIVGIEAQKALTKNTFAGIALERRLDGGDRGALTVMLETGATF